MAIHSFQKKRARIPFFAPWAKISRPFQGDRHVLEGDKICFDTRLGEAYANHIEMSGFYCSSIISYGVDSSGILQMMRHVVFPALRLYPNQTHSSLDHNFNGVSLKINGEAAAETAHRFVFDGILHIDSRCGEIEIDRSVFTARNSQACVELLRLTNTGREPAAIELVNHDEKIMTKPRHGVNRASYCLFAQIDEQRFTIPAGDCAQAAIAYCGANAGERVSIDCRKELAARQNFLAGIAGKLVIETPDRLLNTMAQYAKIRACESIYQTKSGLMHSPGGGGYYAALWTNDQCEYVNPLFGYLGYQEGIEEGLNCYALYQKFISHNKALITSIIAGGDGIWHGAKDRGDSAMYAYGCSRFLLSLGDKEIAARYMDGIRGCIDFTLSRINQNGVVESDSDELENRFQSGKANLCTSCLACDALISSAYLEKELGSGERSAMLLQQAAMLRGAIEQYFGSTVEGYHTYRYCMEEGRLRSWIAMPLTVGITERAAATADALLTSGLRKNEGLVTRNGEETFWDRSTLYALRGLFYAGQQEQAMELLETYTRARLLGEHIPYAVEAYPEGNQAQLSAESGLYLRIFTEGLLGYRPTGLRQFEIMPHLPQKWNCFSIKNMVLCGKNVNITVQRIDHGYEIVVNNEHKKQEEGKAAEFLLQA